jgi:hypothetical protein
VDVVRLEGDPIAAFGFEQMLTLYSTIRVDTHQFGYVGEQQGDKEARDALAAADVVDSETMLILRDQGKHVVAVAATAATAATAAVAAVAAASFGAWNTKLIVVIRSDHGAFASQGLFQPGKGAVKLSDLLFQTLVVQQLLHSDTTTCHDEQ